MAIDDLLDEHEQSERVRSWLRQNGAGLIGGVVLGLAAIAGWQWWQQQQQVANQAAGQRFEAALKAIESNDLKKAQPAVAALDKDGAAYATLAGLQLAKAQVDAGQRDAAIATLRALKSDDAALSAVLQSRLARLLTDAGKPAEALKVLGDKPQSAAELEARADAFAALGKREDARDRLRAGTGETRCRRAAAPAGRTQTHRGRRQPGPHRGPHPMMFMRMASMQRKSILKAFLVVACVFALAGCTTVKGWFGGKDDDKLTEPAELVEFTPTATVSKLWSVGVGKGEGRIGIHQGPSIADGRVYAAAIGGGVRAFDLQTGAAQWHFDPKPEKDQPKLRLSGGPGAGEGLVVVGGLDGEVIALDASNGAEKWRAKVGNEVIAVAGDWQRHGVRAQQ